MNFQDKHIKISILQQQSTALQEKIDSIIDEQNADPHQVVRQLKQEELKQVQVKPGDIPYDNDQKVLGVGKLTSFGYNYFQNDEQIKKNILPKNVEEQLHQEIKNQLTVTKLENQERKKFFTKDHVKSFFTGLDEKLASQSQITYGKISVMQKNFKKIMTQLQSRKSIVGSQYSNNSNKQFQLKSVDLRQIFNPFLKKQIAQHLFEEDQDGQHSPRLQSSQHQIFQTKLSFSDCWTFNFMRGLYYELGFCCQQDYKQSIKEYLKGCECLDSMCFYRLAEVYSDPKNHFEIQVDPDISLFYFFVSSALIDYQYASNLIDYEKTFQPFFTDEVSAQKFCEDQLKKHGHLLPQPLDFNSAIISCFFQYKYSENQGGEAQIKYENLLNFFFQIFSRIDKPDACFLLLIMRLFNLQTHIRDKKVKLFIELVQLCGKSLFIQACEALRKQFLFTTQLSEDNEMYFRQREILFEIFFIYRNCFDNKNTNVPSTNNDITICKQIGEKLYQICKMLYIGNAVIESQLHNVLLIRMRSKLIQIGMDPGALLDQAQIVIEMELQIKKSRHSLYAHPMYILAKIKYKMKDVLDTTKIVKIIDLFKQMYKESQPYGKFIAIYYIGRIHQIFLNKLTIAFRYYQEALTIFEQNQIQFQQARTTYYYVYYQKCFKHIEKIQNSELFQTQVEQRKSVRQSKLNCLKEKYMQQQAKEQSNGNQLNINIVQKQNVDIKSNKSKKEQQQQKEIISESDDEDDEKQEEIKMIKKESNKNEKPPSQYQRANRRSFTNDAKLLISHKAAQDIIENQYKMKFLDFYSLIEVEEFVCKGDIGTTSFGILNHGKESMRNIQINDNKNKLKLKVQTKTMQNKALSWNQEAVVLKFISFNALEQKRNLIIALGKLRLLKKFDKLLSPLAFSGVQVENQDFQIIIIYPRLSYNLQGLILQKKMPTMKEMLKVSLQIAYSLKDLHTHGLSHGDLKPNNILSDLSLRICISDWEFSQFLDKKNSKIRKNKLDKKKGNDNEDDDEIEPDADEPLMQLGYVAPEQISDEQLKNSENIQITQSKKGMRGPYSDIWSFGMILNYIFFKQDATEQDFLSDQLLYFGNDIDITYYKVGSDLFLDKIKQLIENMVKFKPIERVNIHNVCIVLEKLMKRQMPQQSRLVSQELLYQIDQNPEEFDRIARILQRNYLKKKRLRMQQLQQKQQMQNKKESKNTIKK